MNITINKPEEFVHRHLGSNEVQINEMLHTVEAKSIEELIKQTIPQSIRLKENLSLPAPQNEFEFLHYFRKLAAKNRIFKTFIGMGYHNTLTPGVIQRNILENPGWYTAYTPYQAEIAQGRLEALLNYQTMVIELTGMEIANASLLDEGTAAAEAMIMAFANTKGAKKKANKFFLDQNTFPQTIDAMASRAEPKGINMQIDNLGELNLTDPELFAILLQYPDNNGAVTDYSALIQTAHDNNVMVIFAADLLSLTLLTPPGEMGADIVVGTTQRFGIPLGYGGPHAAYFATKAAYKRQIPGRIIGISKDSNGNPAYRMALQTREQHIRREKATSNICTAQVLLAVMAGMYAVYHGPNGLKDIAKRIHGFARLLSNGLESLGFKQTNDAYFDTIKIDVRTEELKNRIMNLALNEEYNFRYFKDNSIGISLNETSSEKNISIILSIFAKAVGLDHLNVALNDKTMEVEVNWPKSLIRTSTFLEHDVFKVYHSEHEMLRYLKRLENKDLSLVHSMIALGSCTMKLNATSEMIPVSWLEFQVIHPFAPDDQVLGYKEMIFTLENWLNKITGFSGTSLQPNSGAQGEYAGLMVIKAYLESKGEGNRNIALIPASAHGTNPASAVMANMDVVIVACDELGNIDITDLKAKAEEHSASLASLMITYPSTHGVYEEGVIEICEIIHQHGGQVYMDGANMNAQVGLTSPANIGADVCHLNLHKTFSIPHGGGGPGVGPICVAEHLVPFLPGNPVVNVGGDKAIKSISAAPYGSANVLAISYAYIALMGGEGLKQATELAILNANYIKARLENDYPILYTGKNGRCAHEMIADCRHFKAHGIEVEDIAKRLMDYGFHAPTVSFPVPGTLMIEPTESESKEELDRFCDALIQIKKEIKEVIEGKEDATNNVLKNAPHTIELALSEEWDLPYSRTKAVYPLPFVKDNKFWPSVGRIDNAQGDRNLVCSCAPIEAYK